VGEFGQFRSVEETMDAATEAAMNVIKAKLALWDATVELERLLGFDVDTNGDELNDICACLGKPSDVTVQDAQMYLDSLRADA
jgi:hypothetical protein